MSLNEYNEELVARLLATINAFDGAVGRIDSLQAQLQSMISLLENDGSRASELVRLAEADVEEIRYTRLLDEQGRAVAERMARLANELEGLAA